MEDNRIQEYNHVREEINQKIELHNSLLTFTITTTSLILTIALPGSNPFFFLIPFFIIIPMSKRIAYYRGAMAKLSTYLIVYIESSIDGIKWETRNSNLASSGFIKKESLISKLSVIQYIDCLFLSIVCYVCYVWYFIKYCSVDPVGIVKMILPFLFVIWEAIITKRTNDVDKEREEWIELWEKLKKTEEQNNSH